MLCILAHPLNQSKASGFATLALVLMFIPESICLTATSILSQVVRRVVQGQTRGGHSLLSISRLRDASATLFNYPRDMPWAKLLPYRSLDLLSQFVVKRLPGTH